MIQIIPFTTEEAWKAARAQDVTSTEVSCLFNCNPYMSKYEYWHIKAGKYSVEFTETDRTRWGNRLQDSIANGIAADEQWQIRPMTEYLRNPELRAGSSFDYEILSPESGILEIKNVDSLRFWDGWLTEGTEREAPPHIEIQVQHQLMVSGKSLAYIGALVGGNRIVLLRRTPDFQVIEKIKQAIEAFWFSIGAGQPPEPSLKQDADFIAKLYRYAEPGKVFDACGNGEILQLAMEYKALGDQAKEIDTSRAVIKAQLLQRIGDAEKVSGDGFSITANMVGPARVEYDRDGYRMFRINWSKKKGTK